MTNHQHGDQPDITQHEVTAVVKWFNAAKGFGFVQPSDGSPDAFLHISVVEQSGLGHLPEGATIVCDLSAGQKGPQVAAVHRIESMPEPPPRVDDSEGTEAEGTVKFYNREKGFGFVTPDNGGADVFISARTLESAGIHSLDPEQRVRMAVRMGQKGPMAGSIALI